MSQLEYLRKIEDWTHQSTMPRDEQSEREYSAVESAAQSAVLAAVVSLLDSYDRMLATTGTPVKYERLNDGRIRRVVLSPVGTDCVMV